MLGSKRLGPRAPSGGVGGRAARRNELARDLVEIAAGLDRARGVEAVSPRSPVEVLAQRSDLVGSVAVAEVLANDDWPEAEPRVDDGRWLADHVALRLRSSQRWLERTLADPTKGRSPLPGPARVHKALVEEHARAGRPNDWLPKLAAELARPWTHRCLATVRTIRREASRLRTDSAGDLRALGPGSARLERLDAALRRSLATAQGDADQALAHRFGETYAHLLTRFVETFEDPSALPIDALERFHLAGPAAQLRADMDAAARAVLREERALLEALVRACIDSARASVPSLAPVAGASTPPPSGSTEP